jgi:hypothetical protein
MDRERLLPERYVILNDGAEVRSLLGEPLGVVGRIVVDPADLRVTHLVVLSGSPFDRGRVVPLSSLIMSMGDPVLTSSDAISSFMPFDERKPLVGFGPPRRAETSFHQYPAMPWRATMPEPSPGHQLATQKIRNTPEGAVAVRSGAEMISSDGHRLGRLVEVAIVADSGFIHQVGVVTGSLRLEWRSVPAGWLAALTEKKIHLAVVRAEFRGLSVTSEVGS